MGAPLCTILLSAADIERMIEWLPKASPCEWLTLTSGTHDLRSLLISRQPRSATSTHEDLVHSMWCIGYIVRVRQVRDERWLSELVTVYERLTR